MTRGRLGRRATWAVLVSSLWCLPIAAAPQAKPGQTPGKPVVQQTPPPVAVAIPAGTAQISGLVRSDADDSPIARARVLAMSDVLTDPRVTITGTDGKYSFSDLPAGSYIVTVIRSGYAPQTYGQTRIVTGTPIVVTESQPAANIDVALVPGASIVGRILDEDGTPFAGATVDALITRTDGGANALFSIATAQTDDRGEFRLFGLSPGHYYISAADPAFRSVSTPKGVLHYSPTYYPGVPFADQAKPVVVIGTGEPPKIEYRLKLVPPARVTGQLVAYDARQLLSGAIIMSPVGGAGVPMVPPEEPSILPDGTFAFGGVVPGHYQIRARGQTDPTGAALFAVFSILIEGGDIDGIRMTLRPGAIIDGTLAIESARGTKPPVLPTIRVRAPFTDGNSFGDSLTGTVQPDGTFSLRGVMEGSHQLVLDGLQPPWTLKNVLLRGSDIADLQLEVAEKEQLHDIRITISDAGSEVRGTVVTPRGRPVPNIGVLVFSRVPLFWMRTDRRMRIAFTDRDGGFAVAGLPAGEYIAVASATVDESDLGRQDRLEAWAKAGTTFKLAADDSRASVKLQLLAPAALLAPFTHR